MKNTSDDMGWIRISLIFLTLVFGAVFVLFGIGLDKALVVSRKGKTTMKF
jgi:hypothetical protein